MAAACSTFTALSPLPLSSSTTRTRVPICSFPRSTHFTTNLVHNTTQIPTRLRISQKIGVVPNHVFRVRILCCLGDNPSQVPSELAPDDLKEATVDLKLPRRSLLVHFTCNTCGERTQKLINRVAYERGTVFVQCTGCLQHHKLIDNLGLVVEYDFREESDMNSKADQV